MEHDKPLQHLEDDEEKTGTKERRKIEIKFIHDKSRRHITFSKRKAGIMKKAYELSVLTGTQVLLLVVSETGLVYTFTTPKLQPLVTKPEGKNLIQACLNAPEPSDEEGDDQDEEDAHDAQVSANAAAQAAVSAAAQAHIHPTQVPRGPVDPTAGPGGYLPEQNVYQQYFSQQGQY